MACYRKLHLIAQQLLSLAEKDPDYQRMQIRDMSIQDITWEFEELEKDIEFAKQLGLQLRSEIYRLEAED